MILVTARIAPVPHACTQIEGGADSTESSQEESPVKLFAIAIILTVSSLASAPALAQSDQQLSPEGRAVYQRYLMRPENRERFNANRKRTDELRKQINSMLKSEKPSLSEIYSLVDQERAEGLRFRAALERDGRALALILPPEDQLKLLRDEYTPRMPPAFTVPPRAQTNPAK